MTPCGVLVESWSFVRSPALSYLSTTPNTNSAIASVEFMERWPRKCDSPRPNGRNGATVRGGFFFVRVPFCCCRGRIPHLGGGGCYCLSRSVRILLAAAAETESIVRGRRKQSHYFSSILLSLPLESSEILTKGFD